MSIFFPPRKIIFHSSLWDIHLNEIMGPPKTSFSLDDTLAWLAGEKTRKNMKAVLMGVIKTPALTGNNYKILLLVIIPTIQPRYQCSICHTRPSVSTSVTDLSRFQKSLSLLLSGEKKDRIPLLGTLLTPVPSFCRLIYFQEKKSISLRLLDL